MPQLEPPTSPVDDRPRSPLGSIAFVLTLVAPLLMVGVSVSDMAIGPLFGFLGTLGAILGIADRVRTGRLDAKLRPNGFAIAAILFGIAETLPATACAGCWISEPRPPKGSCPHVYAFDGASLHLDADALSGALRAGAEREDRIRLDHLRPVEGRYRLRVRDELQETDYIDRIALLAVDHPPGTEVLPDPEGELVLVGAAASPSLARDQAGRDLRDKLGVRDDRGVTGRAGDHPDGTADPRMQLTIEFAPPAGAPVLVLRARNTWFGEEVFARYFARIGAGATTLLEWAGAASGRPFKDLLRDEMRRVGLLMKVEARAGDRWVPVAELLPFGPAVAREVAIPLPAAAQADGPIAVRLEMTPLLWSVDATLLAARDRAPLAPRVLLPTAARDAAGHDLTALLSADDERRLVLHTGDEAELDFAAPSVVPDRRRTVLLAMRGFYELGAGGDRRLDLVALWRDRTGRDSLGRSALRAARGATAGDIEAETTPGP